MNARQVVSWGALVVASVGVHAGVFAGLAGDKAAPGPLEKKLTFVEMTTTPPPEPPPPVATAKPAARGIRRSISRMAKAAAPTSAPPSEQPEAETVADFSGTTLTGGAGWASATGNGQRLNGPIGKPGARVTGNDSEGSPPAGPPVVGAGDLSRVPQAPALDEALERNYPPAARRVAQTGKAVVRARVMPDGQVRELTVASESAPGFGRACQATLTGSRWTPPIDREGRSVSTYIQYTCRFEVR